MLLLFLVAAFPQSTLDTTPLCTITPGFDLLGIDLPSFDLPCDEPALL